VGAGGALHRLAAVPSTPSAPPPLDGGGDDDRELLAALRDGDEGAYARFVTRYGARMLAVARRILRDEEEARDAVQEAYLLAFRALPRFAGESRVSTWLHRIVVNAALMRIRRRKARPEEAIDALLPAFRADGHATEVFRDWREGADALLERRETRELVRAAIDRLPESYRLVVLLRDIDELDTAEVAELLGVTPNAVKIRLHRARQALRALLDPHLRTEAT
jgi:RNA polymerase sigma-70 factor (ECF subfamily)